MIDSWIQTFQMDRLMARDGMAPMVVFGPMTVSRQNSRSCFSGICWTSRTVHPFHGSCSSYWIAVGVGVVVDGSVVVGTMMRVVVRCVWYFFLERHVVVRIGKLCLVLVMVMVKRSSGHEFKLLTICEITTCVMFCKGFITAIKNDEKSAASAHEKNQHDVLVRLWKTYCRAIIVPIDQQVRLSSSE